MSDAAETSEETSEENNTVLLDMGKQKPKRVKQLRKGKGKLLDDVYTAIEELQEAGVIGANAQPVVVIVERKSDDLPMPSVPFFPKNMKWG